MVEQGAQWRGGPPTGDTGGAPTPAPPPDPWGAPPAGPSGAPPPAPGPWGAPPAAPWGPPPGPPAAPPAGQWGAPPPGPPAGAPVAPPAAPAPWGAPPAGPPAGAAPWGAPPAASADPFAPPPAGPPPAYPPVFAPAAYPPPGSGAWPAPPGAPPPWQPYGADRPRRRLSLGWVTLVVALLVLLADVLVVASRTGGGSDLPTSVAVEKQLVTESPAKAARRAQERDAAIDAMFDRRARAIRESDLAAFLADVDPTQTEFLGRQREVFDSLRKLDFASWSYERDGESYSPGSIDYARYGDADDLWLPVLILRYQLQGFDVDEVGRRIVYTVVRRDGRWYVGNDRDLADITSSGTDVRVDPWENGPIVVKRGPHGIVIGHPEDSDAIGRIQREVEDAVRHVISYVGRKHWNRKVVVVLPTDDDELDRILENPTTFFEFAAVARHLGTIPRGGGREQFAGSRVVINPDGFDAKSEFTTHLIRHEITHVAMFDRVGPLTPKWLVEGVAEFVGNAGSTLPPEMLAGDLADEVDKNGVPRTLPTDSDFGLINDAGIGYNGAWLLCRYIASRWGRAKLFALHDEVGELRGVETPAKVQNAIRAVLGVTEEQLLAGWRGYVRASVADLNPLLVKPSGYKEVDSGRLDLDDLAEQKGFKVKQLKDANVERVSAGLWTDGPEKSPRRRFITTLVVAADERGAAEVERLLANRLRPYDGSGRPLPHGRIFYVGTEIGGAHYNETIAIQRAGVVVMEVRVAVPGTGDSGGETRRYAAAQYAKVA